MKCNVCKPATVVAWQPPIPGQLPATVTLQIDFNYIRAIDNPGDLRPGETLSVETAGLRAVGLWIPIPNVPVLMFGSPQFQWRGQLLPGTTGLLLFADSILDQWKQRGGPVDPALYERHSLNCGVFIPTLYHGLNTPTINPAVDVLGPNDDTAGFEIATGPDQSIRMYTTGPTANVDAAAVVQLGNPLGPLLAVARQTDPVGASADMTAFMAAVVTALTTIAAAVPVVIVPPIPPAGPIGTITSGSAKVQSE
jgi:hypothetical protein